jgi:hypothetical protein
MLSNSGWLKTALTHTFRYRKRTFECECFSGGSIPTQQVKASFRLFNRRQMPRRNPPQDEYWALHCFEPFSAVAERAGMIALIDVVIKRFHRFPYAHAKEDLFIIVCADRCRVSFFTLETPDKPCALIGNHVDMVELTPEAVHEGIVERCSHPRDICLSEVESVWLHSELPMAF